MYGDTTAIRALAGRLRDQAQDIRAEADALAGQAETVPWRGLAADAMRGLARQHSGDLRCCAGMHDDAADALDRHAREVDHLKDLIAAVERRLAHLVEGAGAGLAGLATQVLTGAVDDWLDHFDPPPRGSVAWLDVHLPRSA